MFCGMKQKPNSLTEHLRHIIRQKGYLLLLSAWLFTLAFLTNHYWTYNASIEKVAKRLENNIREKEQDHVPRRKENCCLP